jgi:hypothetical protein
MYEGQDVRKFLLWYSAASCLCYLLDGLNFLITFRWWSVDGHEYAELVMLWATLVNLLMDCYFVVTVLSLKNKMNLSVGSFIADAFLGYTNKMNRELSHALDEDQHARVEPALRKLQELKENREYAQEALKANAKAEKATKAAEAKQKKEKEAARKAAEKKADSP